MAQKTNASSTGRKAAQVLRTARNKAKAQEKHKARKVGDGSGKLLHSMKNRIKRITRKLKGGVGVDIKNKLEARKAFLLEAMGEKNGSRLIPRSEAVSIS